MPLILTSLEMLEKGLDLAGFKNRSRSGVLAQARRFKAFYGSNPVVLADMWEDLQTTEHDEIRMKLTEAHISHFFMTHHFLYCYPVEEAISAIFGYCEKTCREWCWEFTSKFAQLKTEKIQWPEEWCHPNNPGVPIFLYTVDGVHFRSQEPKHPTLSKNRAYYSHKGNGPGLTYQLALDIWRSRIVQMQGPYPASTHDITIFRNGLKQQTPFGKRGIGDNGYRGEREILSLPNSHDHPELRKFKSRARARQESLNTRIQNFNILKDRFRHNIKKHKIVFEAVCVIVQYQFDNGSPLFEV